MTELDQNLVDRLKGHAEYIRYEAGEQLYRDLYAAIGAIETLIRAAAKAKEPQCKCSLEDHSDAMPPCANYTHGAMGWCDTRIGEGVCAHDLACHSSAVEG